MQLDKGPAWLCQRNEDQATCSLRSAWIAKSRPYTGGFGGNLPRNPPRATGASYLIRDPKEWILKTMPVNELLTPSSTVSTALLTGI